MAVRKRRMNRHVKAKWIAALRSGQYAQGIGRLRNDNQYCCLGVLCDLYDPDGWERVIQGYKFGGTDGEMAALPRVIMSWAKLDDDVGMFQQSTGRLNSLMYLNDTEGKSFAEIADVIEKYF